MRIILILSFISLNLLAKDYVIKSKGFVNVDTGEIVFNKFIYIKNKKIFKISNRLDNGFNLIDISDSYVMPGLIDCHAHLLMTQNLDDKSFNDAMIREEKLTDQFRVDRAKKFLNQYIDEGFTGICDLGNSGNFLDLKLKNEITNNDFYPQLYISGPALSSGNAQFSAGTRKEIIKKEYELIDKNTNIDLILKKYLNHHVDILKIILDGTEKNDLFNENKLKELLSSKFLIGFKKITFHSTSIEAFSLIQKYQLKNVEHSNVFSLTNNPTAFVTITAVNRKTLDLFKYFNPVLSLTQKKIINYISKNKIKPIFGPDYYFQTNSIDFSRGKEVKDSIFELSKLGMSNKQILQSMTINPVISMHIENKVGSIKTGMRADLISVKINPLVDIEALKKVNFVMRSGKIVKNKN